MAKKESLLVGIIVLFLAYAMLPTLGSIVGGALDEATTVLLAVAPKVEVVAGLAALIMLCIPFTRHHAHGMLFAADLAGGRRSRVLDHRGVAAGAQRGADRGRVDRGKHLDRARERSGRLRVG